MKTFVKSTELELVNGGYVSLKDGAKPVTNKEFIKAQKHAEYVVTFAKLAKGKDFKGKEADCLDSLKNEVAAALSAKATVYVAKPEKKAQKYTELLKSEAMDFMKFEEDSSKTEKVNTFLAQFDVLNEFEKFGLFFKEGIVKLDKIYTMEEVITAVTETIELLD